MRNNQSQSPTQATAATPATAAIQVNPATPATSATAATPVTADTPSIGCSNPSGKTWGYVRVSTREQNEARQLIALRDFGITEKCIFMDKQSGKDFNRPAYGQLLAQLRPGDVLVVKSIDRLGRNYNDILEQWRLITKEKQAAIVVLDMPLLDTRNSRDLTGTLIADIVLQLLSYVAETERQFIRQRQAEGIAAAKARGVQFGRKPLPRPEAYPSILQLWREQRISANEAGKRLHIGRNTFLRWAREDVSPLSGN